MKIKFPATVMVFGVVSSEGHIMPPYIFEVGLEVNTWMCWRVWWSPRAIRWPVAHPGCGSRTWHRPTSPKRSRLGFRRSATTLYPSLTGPPPPTWTCWTTSFAHVENITNRTSHNTKDSLIAAIPRVFAELPPALVVKSSCQFRIRIRVEAVIEAEGG